MSLEWKEYYTYKISNTGIILNRWGHRVNPYLLKYKGKDTKLKCTIRIDKKRKSITVANLVYSLFGEVKYNPHMRVNHKDGNPRNCNIENLSISDFYIKKPEKWQIDIYKKEVVPCVKNIISQSHYWGIKGIDWDNIIGECYLYIYQRLYQYKKEYKFYTFCYSRVKSCVGMQIHKAFIEKRRLVSYEWICDNSGGLSFDDIEKYIL